MKFSIVKTYKIHMWMCTGHEFDIVIDAMNESLSCEDIEYIMSKEAIKRGFLGGLNDIESYDVNITMR